MIRYLYRHQQTAAYRSQSTDVPRNADRAPSRRPPMVVLSYHSTCCYRPRPKIRHKAPLSFHITNQRQCFSSCYYALDFISLSTSIHNHGRKQLRSCDSSHQRKCDAQGVSRIRLEQRSSSDVGINGKVSSIFRPTRENTFLFQTYHQSNLTKAHNGKKTTSRR